MRILLFIAVAATAILTSCTRQSEAAVTPGTIPPPAAKQDVTFATDIKPIFDAACIKCHGADKQKAELRLDSREGALKGSEDGPVFEVGKSALSILVTNVARVGDEDDWMPPIDKGKPLTVEQVALIRAWIDQGAK
ncbi:MAG TPA: c-type cytochrome domain-containing protein [Verrucomicrobiae bacterium]|nr:c-type cytochrome domain-containing protein [Verrucomicrobiae bacterium]